MKPAKQQIMITGNNFLLDTNIVIDVFKGNKEHRKNNLNNSTFYH